MIIDLNDKVWFFGENDVGQLGLGDIKNRYSPSPLHIKAKMISLGHSHSILIDMNDNVFSFGNNQYGQLGLGNNDNRSVPVQIQNIKAKSISCGESHSIIIDLQDNVFSFGRNFSGELGLGDVIDRNYPVQVTLPINEENFLDEHIAVKAKSVACGGYHTMLIDLEDNLYSCGNNTYYQLGLPGNNNKLIPTPFNRKIKSVATGGFHTIIIDLEDNVWTFGYNDFGQLGLGNTDNKKEPISVLLANKTEIKAQKIICGYLHSVIIDLENDIYVFGSSIYNQLGLNNIEDIYVPTKVPDLKAKNMSCGVAHTILISSKK